MIEETILFNYEIIAEENPIKFRTDLTKIQMRYQYESIAEGFIKMAIYEIYPHAVGSSAIGHDVSVSIRSVGAQFNAIIKTIGSDAEVKISASDEKGESIIKKIEYLGKMFSDFKKNNYVPYIAPLPFNEGEFFLNFSSEYRSMEIYTSRKDLEGEYFVVYYDDKRNLAFQIFNEFI